MTCLRLRSLATEMGKPRQKAMRSGRGHFTVPREEPEQKLGTVKTYLEDD